jgi:predicted nucleotidyltransferase
MSAVDVARPYTAVCPSLDGEVLRVLAGARSGFTGRQVALLTGRSSHSGVLRVLNRMSDQGLVDRIELNAASLYALNRDHLAAPAVEALAGLRVKLLDRIREKIETWEIKPVHASLFGSAARGDGDIHSDIDVLIVRPNGTSAEVPTWRLELDELATEIGRWTGNFAAIIDRSQTELASLSRDKAPVLTELRSDAITLHGPNLATLLDGA